MESEDEFDMQDANESAEDDDFYSGGEDDAAPSYAYDSDDADVADYEFIDNDSDDSDDLVSHRHQVPFASFGFTHLSWELMCVLAFDDGDWLNLFVILYVFE